MTIEIKASAFPESAKDLTVKAWLKQPGDFVMAGEAVAEIEADKAITIVVAPANGEIAAQTKAAGDSVSSEEVIGSMIEKAAPAIIVPGFPESAGEARISNWVHKAGDGVLKGEAVAEIETAKAVLVATAPVDGYVTETLKAEGDVVVSAEVIGNFEPGVVEQTADEAGAEDAAADAPAGEIAAGLPDNVDDGTLVSWLKSVGDSFSKGDIIAEIETEKAVLEVEAPADGVLTEQLVAEGETVETDALIARYSTDGAAAAPAAAPAGAAADITAPDYPESVDDGTILTWHKAAGDKISRDELLVEIETDKVVMEVVAPADGTLIEILKAEGEVANGQEVIARYSTGDAAPAAVPSAPAGGDNVEIKAPVFPESVDAGTIATWHKQPGDSVKRDEQLVDIETDKVVLEVVAPADGVLAEIRKNVGEEVAGEEVVALLSSGAVSAPAAAAPSGDDRVAPAARVLMAENNLTAAQVTGTGKGGLITKEDVQNHLSGKAAAPAAATPAAQQPAQAVPTAGGRIEKRVPMTRMRSRIAERLLGATNDTAMLTTFNEVNMGPLMELRKKYKDLFEKTHDGARLGFMGFFVKAATEALKRFPAVNASIDGGDIVYHGYQDIGVAVSTPSGLVVPVLRDTDDMSIATVESTIRDFGMRARDGKIGLEEMQGGTFTITNGGVFGSLMSTPILNPPQAAILGMHKIQERPMAVDGEVVIQQMMYLALSYDHRLIDGKEAVQFLVTIKDLIEDPARMLLEI
jgi:2-oxoglutarate dehydrogenase E2 component (dihydrolipoamide succinyltransferase)